MADEAKLIVPYLPAITFTVANATAVEKGTSMMMTDPRTAVASNAIGAVWAGIAASEKIASDGNTSLGIFRHGIFRVTASGSVAVGDPACTSNAAAPNRFEKAATNEEDLVGTFLETATNGQTCLMELNPRGVSLA